jgi:hypothetical protein
MDGLSALRKRVEEPEAQTDERSNCDTPNAEHPFFRLRGNASPAERQAHAQECIAGFLSRIEHNLAFFIEQATAKPRR